jgi:hypothetical protein
MRVTDQATVKTASEALVRVISMRNAAGSRQNQVYNAVAILGTWARVLPDSLAGERKTIENFLSTTQEALKNEPNWDKTYTLLDQLLQLRNRQGGA